MIHNLMHFCSYQSHFLTALMEKTRKYHAKTTLQHGVKLLYHFGSFHVEFIIYFSEVNAMHKFDSKQSQAWIFVRSFICFCREGERCEKPTRFITKAMQTYPRQSLTLAFLPLSVRVCVCLCFPQF